MRWHPLLQIWVDDRDGTTYGVTEGVDGQPGRLTKRLPDHRFAHH